MIFVYQHTAVVGAGLVWAKRLSCHPANSAGSVGLDPSHFEGLSTLIIMFQDVIVDFQKN